MSRIAVLLPQFLCLLVDGVGHFGAAIADVDAIESRERIDVALALMVFDANALCARHDLARQRAACVVARVRGRVNEVAGVLLEHLLEWVLLGLFFLLGLKTPALPGTPGICVACV